MLIPDHVIQIVLVFHIHIKESAALFTSGVIVPIAAMVKSIRPARKFPLCDFSKLTKTVQIPVNRSFADMRMLFCDILVNFLSGCVTMKLAHSI